MTPSCLITLQRYLQQFFTVGFTAPCLWCTMSKPPNAAEFLCTLCEKDLPFARHSCLQCGHELFSVCTNNNQRCGICEQKPTNNRFIHAFTYSEPINHFIHQLKFKGKLIYARFLGNMLSDVILQAYRGQSLPTLILPMPLHVTRLQERGFNQALEIARPIAQRLHLSLNTRWLTRHKPTQAQSGLNKKQRHHNVKNAFLADPKLQHHHIAVIDDVSTTGATRNAVEHALKQVHCQRIDFWCAAKA